MNQIIRICFNTLVLFETLAGSLTMVNLSMAEDSFAEQTLAWRAEHEAKYTAATGWLALTNLDWLQEGENLIGTSRENAIVLPAGSAPELAGSIRLSGDQVEITSAANDLKLSVNGELVKSAKLEINAAVAESNSKDEVILNERLRLQLIRRSGKYAIRVRDPQSESLRKFKGMNWYEFNDAYRVDATYQRYEPSKRITVINSRGDSVEADVPGYVEFNLSGRTFRLDAQRESETELLIVFADLTNKTTTYQPGRFLDVLEPKGDKLILDFNRAYNPPCAFSQFTLCPMPPAQNRLSIAVEAGEKRVAK